MRPVPAAICLCWFAILLSARAQTIEVPRETNMPVPLGPHHTVSSSPRAQGIRVSRAPAVPPRELPEFVDIAGVDPSIVIDLRYATEQNVTGHALYRRGTRAMILPSVAQQLAGAQKYLAQFRYRLKIWDAYRPQTAQEQLWHTTHNRSFVADPKEGRGSMHIRGAAVDATLVDAEGHDVPMPTDFDSFTPAAFLESPA